MLWEALYYSRVGLSDLEFVAKKTNLSTKNEGKPL